MECVCFRTCAEANDMKFVPPTRSARTPLGVREAQRRPSQIEAQQSGSDLIFTYTNLTAVP